MYQWTTILLILLIIPGITPGIVSAADGWLGDGENSSNGTTHADLIIKKLYTDPEVPGPDSDVSIYAVVSNTGDAASDPTSIIFTIDGVSYQENLDSIDPGSDVTVTHSWKTPDKEGTVKIKASIDGVKNSQREIPLSVNSQLPELKIKKLYTDPKAPEPDSDVSIYAVVSNTGDAASDPTSIIFTIDGVSYQEDLDSIDPGSVVTVPHSWKTPDKEGSLKITASIDDVENIQQEILLSVKNQLPDLIIQSIVPEPANPQKGDALSFTVKVKNQGAVLSGDALATYYINGVAGQDISIPSLSGGASTNIEFSLTPDQVNGENIEVRVVADSGNTVLESNENNNVATKTVTVGSSLSDLPDLTVESISLSPETPKVGDNIGFTAIVKNNGQGASPISKLNYNIIGNSETSSSPLSVPALTAGDTTPITFSWTPTNEGNIEVTALVDPDAVVPESDETNNQLIVNATVTKESTSGGGGGGSSSSGKSGSSSGGGIGSSYSKEPAKNVASKELATRNVMSGNHVRFDFLQNSTCIQYIEYDALRTFMKTTTTVEELKGKSTFVPERPSGSLYKYVNIWVGEKGGGLPASLANGVVGFKVEKSWIYNNSVNESLVSLQWYNKSWEPLYTKKVGEDNNCSYFTSTAPGFSFFAITYTGETDENGTQTGAKLQDTLLGSLEGPGNATLNGNKSKAEEAKGAAKILMAVTLPLFLILVGYLVFKKRI